MIRIPAMHTLAVNHLREHDPRLRAWIDRIGVINLPARRSRDPYLALLESIAYQQLAGAAARTIWNRVLNLFEDSIPRPERLLDLSDDQLRSTGLSRSKAASMKAIATAGIAGRIPTPAQIARMPESAIRAQLTQIRGVGPWTVDMLLIFTLRRPDVMPLNDYGVLKGFQILRRKKTLPAPKQLLKSAELWQPYRTAAALYLWRIADARKSATLTS